MNDMTPVCHLSMRWIAKVELPCTTIVLVVPPRPAPRELDDDFMDHERWPMIIVHMCDDDEIVYAADMLRHWDTLSRFECRTAVARVQSFNSNFNAMRQCITYCSTVQVWICWTVQDWITIADFLVNVLERMRWNLEIRASSWKFRHSMNPFVNAYVHHWWINWWIQGSSSSIICSFQ